MSKARRASERASAPRFSRRASGKCRVLANENMQNIEQLLSHHGMALTSSSITDAAEAATAVQAVLNLVIELESRTSDLWSDGSFGPKIVPHIRTDGRSVNVLLTAVRGLLHSLSYELDYIAAGQAHDQCLAYRERVKRDHKVAQEG